VPVRNEKVVREIAIGNQLAARIILANPVKYDGLPLIWARLWVRRQKEG
jgi:hypothetical protein